MKNSHRYPVRLALGAALIAAAFPVIAIGLGSPRGTVVMGQPLDIVIPVVGDEAAGLRASCIQLLSAAGAADDHLPRVEVSLGKQGAVTVIRLRGSRDISSPILDFRVRLECGLAFEKEYTLLPDAYIAPVVEPATVTRVVAPVAPESVPLQTAATTTAADPNALVIESDTTLRQIARQRYPTSAKRRVAFIRRMAAANPERFEDPRTAADTVLRNGEQLRRPRPAPPPPPSAMRETPTLAPAPTPKPAPVAVAKPEPKPGSESTPATESRPAPPPAAPKAAAAKPDAMSGDRLLIGSGGGSDKPGQKMSIGEATQTMDRMNELMNQQIQMQMEMTKQIGELHGQIEQLRNTLNAVQVEKQQVERKLEEERSSPSHYLQLILAIIAGGLGGAGVLGWLSRRRNEEE